MADWSNPQLTSTYTNTLTEIKDRDVDLALQFDGTTSTNLATGTIRWSSSANRWQKWSGSTWAELTGTYALTGLSTTGAASIGTTLGVTGIATLSGGGTSTTPATDNNTTNIATTAFVVGQAAATAPIVDGTAAVGTSLRYARQDHVHPTDTSRAPIASPTFTGTVIIPAGASISGYAPLASPTFTGTPATTTAAVGTNTTQIASTAYVKSEISSSNAANVTGTVAIGNGGTGQTSAAAALAALLPSQTGNSGKSLVTDGSTASWGTPTSITRATAVNSTSGTAIDFTGIPSWVKRVTVMFSGVSTNGTSNILIQLGTSSGFETSGYDSAAHVGVAGTGDSLKSTTGFTVDVINGTYITAATIRQGIITFTNLSGNTWCGSGVLAQSNTAGVTAESAGVKTTASQLTQVRITTAGGTNTFDAGAINILYEG